MLKDINIRSRDGRKKRIRIIYQDDNILAVDKPTGLPVIPYRWDPNLPNLLDVLSLKLKKTTTPFEKIWTVHRIDADTSGLVLFAKTPNAHKHLCKAFEENRIHKIYLAIVNGSPEPLQGMIDLPIGKERGSRMKIDSAGKQSVTKYKVIEIFKHFSLLEIEPITGRTHQIRVHLKAIGHPLAVDPVYHQVDRIAIHQIKKIRKPVFAEQEQFLITRLSLHAWKIKFDHPVSGEDLKLECPAAKDFKAVLKALRKWNGIN